MLVFVSFDPDGSGCPHIAHVRCSLVAINLFYYRTAVNDNRYNRVR